VRVIACRLEDDTRLVVRSGDALADLARRVAPACYLSEATLRLELYATREPVDVWIGLPNRIAFSAPRFEPEARATMTVLGLCSPGVAGDDLTTYAPWKHPEWRWRALVGDDGFEALTSAKVLRRVSTRLPADASLRRYGSLFVSFPLEGEDGAAYAVADDWGVRARTVAADAGARWELVLDEAMRRLRDALELAPGDALELPDALADVGELRAGATRLRFVAMVRPVATGREASACASVRRACKGSHVVLLVPRARTLGGVLAEVALTPRQQLGVDPLEGVVARGAEETGAEVVLEGWRWSTREAPLVILEEREEAWLGRARLSELTDNQFRMLRGLAREAGRWVNVKTLGERISPGATIPDQVVRKARADFDERVRRSLKKAGVSPPPHFTKKLVETDLRRGYRLGLGVIVR
jgi:hypothetical protein